MSVMHTPNNPTESPSMTIIYVPVARKHVQIVHNPGAVYR